MKHHPELIGVRVPGTNRLRPLTREEQTPHVRPEEPTDADSAVEQRPESKDAQ